MLYRQCVEIVLSLLDFSHSTGPGYYAGIIKTLSLDQFIYIFTVRTLAQKCFKKEILACFFGGEVTIQERFLLACVRYVLGTVCKGIST